MLEFAYIPLCVWALKFVFAGEFSVMQRIGIMIIPHVAIAVLIRQLFFRPLLKKYRKKSEDTSKLGDASINVIISFALSTLVAVLCGAFYLNYHDSFLINLLISVGLNVIPTIVTFLILCLLVTDKNS